MAEETGEATLPGAAARAHGPGAAVQVRDLTVSFPAPGGPRPAVAGVSLDLPRGQITGLVGESGSGKSTLALTLLNAVPEPGHVASGSVVVEDIGDVLALRRRELRRVRGAKIGYVFQASQNSLNPLKQVGKQVLDLGRSHGVRDRRRLLHDASLLIDEMGLDAERVLASYQHELSGGMRQRVGIALALLLNAHVLILDEPTTALDMLTQASVLRIIQKVHAERHLSTLIISHDMGVVADLADRMAVMYAGRIVEEGPTASVLAHPKHPYTRGLLTAMPRITGDVTAARPLQGRVPDLASVPRQGCVFRPRCPLATDACAAAEPADTVLGDTVPAGTGPAGTGPAGTGPGGTGPGGTGPGGTGLGEHRFACFVTAGEAA